MGERERFFFDVNGYLSLGELARRDQLDQLRSAIDRTLADDGGDRDRVETVRSGPHAELRNVVEMGACFLQLAATVPIPSYLQELVWGEQVRLIGSRALIRSPGAGGDLTQGGNADPRRYKRFRAFVEGEFRCLMVSVLLALDDTADGDGAIAIVPASHKANFAHPYGGVAAERISVLRAVPLPAGHAVLFSENASYALMSVVSGVRRWLLLQYGPSYARDWPGCTPSAATRAAAAAAGPELELLLREPYYH